MMTTNDPRGTSPRRLWWTTGLVVLLLLLAGLLRAEDHTHGFAGAEHYFVREVTGSAHTTPAEGQTVHLNGTDGSITVTAWDEDSIDVKAIIEGILIDDRNRALFERESSVAIHSDLNGYAVEIDVPEGFAVETDDLPHTICGRIRELSDGRWRYTPQAKITLEVKVPRHVGLDIRTQYGDVVAGDVDGAVLIKNTSGEVSLARIGGPVHVENRYGRVAVVGCRRNVEIRNESGEVLVEDAEAEVDVRTSYEATEIVRAAGPVRITSESGDVTAREIGADLQVEGSYGHLVLEGIAGPARVRSASSRVELADVRGDVDLVGNYEALSVRNVTGDLLLASESCEVSVAEVTGDVDLRASYDDVNVRDVGGGCRIEAESAAVVLADVGGDVRVRTSYEEVRAERIGGLLDVEGASCPVIVDGVRGPLSVATSYEYVVVSGTASSITISGDSSPVEISGIAALPSEAFIDVRTTYDRIELRLPAEASVTVDAQTSDGEIESEIPLTRSRNGHQQATAVLGGGASRVTLRTSGDIIIGRED